MLSYVAIFPYPQKQRNGDFCPVAAKRKKNSENKRKQAKTDGKPLISACPDLFFPIYI